MILALLLLAMIPITVYRVATTNKSKPTSNDMVIPSPTPVPTPASSSSVGSNSSTTSQSGSVTTSPSTSSGGGTAQASTDNSSTTATVGSGQRIPDHEFPQCDDTQEQGPSGSTQRNCGSSTLDGTVGKSQ